MNNKTSIPNDMSKKTSTPNNQRIPCRSSIAFAVYRGKKANASKSAQQSSTEKMTSKYRPP